jgi:hypothetical protein
MLVVSVGPRPATSRPANSTREYEPGSGDRHDPAPGHHPHHPARSPPAVVALVWGAPQPTGPPLQPQGCCASPKATDLRSALDPGASASPDAGHAGRPTTLPRPPGAPQTKTTTASTGAGTAITPRPPQHTPAQNPAGQQDKTQHPTKKRAEEPRVVDRPFHMNIHVRGMSMPAVGGVGVVM